MNTIVIDEQDLDLLHAVARGKVYKQAGLLLGVSEQTVKKRIHRLLDLFGANHIGHLLAICIATDVVWVPDLNQDVQVMVRSYSRRNALVETYRLAELRRQVVLGAMSR